MNRTLSYATALLFACTLAAGAAAKKKETSRESGALDRYIEEAMGRGQVSAEASAGSLWSPGSPLGDLARDLRASHVDDLVTIQVLEQASAVSKGSLKTARNSSVKSSVSALAGVTRAAGPWANLAGLSGDTQVNGEGTTSRETTLSATLAARVTHVLPNGYLVVEGTKQIGINSERQVITVRGVARPADLIPGNLIRSDRLAQLEVSVNGKGVVGDAVRRPFFLYRLLLGLLPL